MNALALFYRYNHVDGGDARGLIYALVELLIFCLVVYVILWVIQSLFGLPAQVIKIVYIICALLALLFALDVFGVF